MEHSFNTEFAKLYGVNCALIAKSIYFWCKNNEEKDINFHNGRYWIYNSIREWMINYPYLTSNQIRHALTRLLKEGIIVKGNYNKKKYDRTIWYSFNNSHSAICYFSQMDLWKQNNGYVKTEQPIPDTNPISNTDSKKVFKGKELKVVKSKFGNTVETFDFVGYEKWYNKLTPEEREKKRVITPLVKLATIKYHEHLYK